MGSFVIDSKLALINSKIYTYPLENVCIIVDKLLNSDILKKHVNKLKNKMTLLTNYTHPFSFSNVLSNSQLVRTVIDLYSNALCLLLLLIKYFKKDIIVL